MRTQPRRASGGFRALSCTARTVPADGVHALPLPEIYRRWGIRRMTALDLTRAEQHLDDFTRWFERISDTMGTTESEIAMEAYAILVADVRRLIAEARARLA